MYLFHLAFHSAGLPGKCGHLWPPGEGRSSGAELGSLSSAGTHPALISSHRQRSATRSPLSAARPETLTLTLEASEQEGTGGRHFVRRGRAFLQLAAFPRKLLNQMGSTMQKALQKESGTLGQ